jgi:hypothetical protein
MGQTIQIWDANVVSDMLLVSTDRSLTGQDGETYRPNTPTVGTPTNGDPVATDAIFPAQLAERLFQSDSSIDHVYVMSNVLSIRRPGGWDDASVASTRDVVASFFLFYGAQPPDDSEVLADAEPAEEA